MGIPQYGKSERYAYRPKPHLTVAGAYADSRQNRSPAEREWEHRRAVDKLLGRITAREELDPDTARRILHPEEGLELFSEAIGTLQYKAEGSDKLSKQRLASLLADIRNDAVEVIMNGPIGGDRGANLA